MELDITDFFNNAAPMDYSASQAELGPTAGPDTWRAANDDSTDYPILDTDEKREAFRAFVRSSGGWNDEEIAAFSDAELNALCIQWIAGDMREVPDMELGPNMTEEEWARYYILCNEGVISSRIFRGDVEGSAGFGRIFFYIGE